MNNVIVKDTLEAWNPFYEKPLVIQEGLEIQNNLLNFASCLQNWQDNENNKKEIA